MKPLEIIIVVALAIFIFGKLSIELHEANLKLQKCKMETSEDVYEVIYQEKDLIDTAYIDTIVTHFGNHPKSIIRDTLFLNVSIKIDTIN